MSILVAGPEPITDRRDLVAALERGNKPRDEWRIGTEHEKFPFCMEGLTPIPYGGEHGIRAMLEGLPRFGSPPIYAAANITLLHTEGASNTSLEPRAPTDSTGAAPEPPHPP